jgi:hypothetical protein
MQSKEWISREPPLFECKLELADMVMTVNAVLIIKELEHNCRPLDFADAHIVEGITKLHVAWNVSLC